MNQFQSGPTQKVRGIALAPLYKTVPIAAMRDPALYEELALVDALRDGRTCELKLAEQEIKKLLRKEADG
jgi:hypothetical protein